MSSRIPLPPELGTEFSVRAAHVRGIGEGRLRNGDLRRPFPGVRQLPTPVPPGEDSFAAERRIGLERIRGYAVRMTPREFISHDSAALLWGAPLPPFWTPGTVHSAVRDRGGLPTSPGVSAHRLTERTAEVAELEGIRVSSPASTWAMLGRWRLIDLVVLGDYLCRVHREGHGRPDAGTPPLAAVADLAAALRCGRRLGIPRLREALTLVRTDSWSPRETECRLALLSHGLPEPDLNVDLFDRRGDFLACVDMAYPGLRIAIEYQGAHHSGQYADDIERVERLRAEGWIVIQVTSTLLAAPWQLASRVRRAIRSRS